MLLLEDRKRFSVLKGKPLFDHFIPPRFGGRGYPPPAEKMLMRQSKETHRTVSIGASVADELAVGGSYDFCDKYKGGTLYLGMGGGKSFDATSGETLDVWHGNIYDIVDGWCDDILEWD